MVVSSINNATTGCAHFFALKSPYFNYRIILINERTKMSKIRMNTEFRNKILNRYVESAETETTQEQQAYLGAREKVNELYPQAFRLATDVV